MVVWVKIREECLFFIWFCFIGVLECSMSLSAACVCLGPSEDHKPTSSALMNGRISEVSTFFLSFLKESLCQTALVNLQSLSIHYGLTHQIQVVLIITPLLFANFLFWLCGTVPLCPVSMVWFISAAWQLQYLITNNTCIPREVYGQTGCFGWPSVKTIGKGYL